MTATRAVVLRCTTTSLCDFHRDGGPEVEKCPGVCDAPGCTADGWVDVGNEKTVCTTHGGLILLGRAVREALAADDAAAKGGAL